MPVAEEAQTTVQAACVEVPTEAAVMCIGESCDSSVMSAPVSSDKVPASATNINAEYQGIARENAAS